MDDQKLNQILLALIEMQSENNPLVSAEVARSRAGMKRYLRDISSRSLKPNTTLIVGNSLVITVGDLDRESPHLGYELSGCAVQVSDLERDKCPHCGGCDCCYQCDGSTINHDAAAEVAGRLKSNGGLHGIESLVLACAVAGIDIESNAFVEAVETAVDAVGNND